MNIITIVIVAGLGLSFLSSAVILAALAVSSRRGHAENFYDERYELESEAYTLNSPWVAES